MGESIEEAHAQEVAAIEAMTGEYCGREPDAYGRSPAQDAMFDIRNLGEAMLNFMSFVTVKIP